MGNFFSSGEKRDREEIVNEEQVTENKDIVAPLYSNSESNGCSSKRIRVESSEQVSVDPCLNADYFTSSMFETDVHVTDVTRTIPTVTVTRNIETEVKIIEENRLSNREKSNARMKLQRD